MHQEIINKIKPELDKVVIFLEKEMAKIRTGRASPSLVEDVIADCFGQKFPIKQLAAISTPETRQILIQPWDNSYIEGIVSALRKTGACANPVVDQEKIRIYLPLLNEEYRKNLIKLISEKQEQAKITVKHWREEAWEEIQERFKQGEIREDDKFRAKDKLQELIDEYNGKIEQKTEVKKKEIME